ncbi:MAG: choice-of-anchor Q domain-containing protein [Thermoguttaceae bacterium]
MQPGSAAFNAGKGLAKVSEDLDRVARPQDAACDIGAFESKAESP